MERHRGFWDKQLDHWIYEGTALLAGSPHDGFCVDRTFHVVVSKGVPGEPGWHVSVRPYCSGPVKEFRTNSIQRDRWWPDIQELFKLTGVEFNELRTSPAEVTHFHEILPDGTGHENTGDVTEKQR